MKLSYNPEKQRRCIACGPVKGQYPLRKVIQTLDSYYNNCVVLECGHYEKSLTLFKGFHPDWYW